jgi:chromatin remodeling complex protein RSC6
MPATTKQTAKSSTTAVASNTSGSKSKKQVEQVVEEPVVEEELEEVENDEVEELEGDDDVEEAEEAEEAEESTDKKKKKYEYTCETVDEGFGELKNIDSQVEELMKYRKVVFKFTEKLAHKQLKQKGKRRSADSSDKPREANGFIKPKSIPQKFKDFYESKLKTCAGFAETFSDFDINVDVPRTTITKMIYHYIKTNELYHTKAGTKELNKRSIKPDSALKTLFDIKSNDPTYDHVTTLDDIKENKRDDPKELEKVGQKAGMSFSNFQTYMNRLYETEDDEVAIEVEEAAEEPVEEVVPKVSKGKKTTSATK